MSNETEAQPPADRAETALVETNTNTNAIAVADKARVPDSYEARYMAGEGTVLHRDKTMAPAALQAMLLVPGLIGAGAMVAAGLWPWALAVLAPFILLWLLFASLRVTVSEGAVNVQYGLFGPTIPTASITAAESTTYDWKDYGGFGIRRAKGEWLYNMPGDKGRAVRIHWRDAKGNKRTHLIGTPNPGHVLGAIREAQSLLPGATTDQAPKQITGGDEKS